MEVCCFDKTGTLTSDNLLFEGVTGLPGAADSTALEATAKKLPPAVVRVLAGCQSLVRVDGQLVGDPLELAAFNAVGESSAPYILISDFEPAQIFSPIASISLILCDKHADKSAVLSAHKVTPERQMLVWQCPVINADTNLAFLWHPYCLSPLHDGAAAAGWKAVEDSTFSSQKEGPQQETVTVLHRFPFTSALKRMAVVLRVQQGGGTGSAVWVVAKGAPEVIEQHLASRPASYEAGYKRYAAEGAR